MPEAAQRFPLMSRGISCVLALSWLVLPAAVFCSADDGTVLKQMYATEVDRRLVVPDAEQARYGDLLARAVAEKDITAEQYFVLVDRSAYVQAVMIYWMSADRKFRFIGASPASTGRPGSFDHFLFAGSVVRRDYQWTRRTKQVKGILNYVGMADGVVAFLPAVFEAIGLRWLDVGGAGAFGFNDAGPPPAVCKAVPAGAKEHIELTEVRYVSGGHSGAISEAFWPEIAAFLLCGQTPRYDRVFRGWGLRALFACAPILTSFTLALAMAIMALPVLAAAAIALFAEEVWSGRWITWLTPLITSHPRLWPFAAAGTVITGMYVSWVFSRFLKVF
jgi:hypothetical protein